jgi:uroporphyrinogen decarboxylase
MVQVFDSWAGELTPYQFEEFALPPIIAIREKFHKVLTELGKPIPCMTLFAKGANDTITLQGRVAGYDTLGLDWTIDPVTARQLADKGSKEGDHRQMTFQGNWDPVVLYAGREGIEKEVQRLAKRFRAAGGPWIANLGHGVTPQVKPEDFGWFLECVHKYTQQ